MKFFEHGFETSEMVSILYWRICHEAVQAGFDPTSLLFACAIHCASRLLLSGQSIRPTPTSCACPTVPSGVAATGPADRLVPGRPRRTDTRRFHISNRDCRGGPVDRTAFRPQ